MNIHKNEVIKINNSISTMNKEIEIENEKRDNLYYSKKIDDMVNQIEQQSKQIQILNEKLNNIIENEKVYENSWIISNFVEKINIEVRIESPYIELYPYSFYILLSIQDDENLKSNILNITLQPSVAIKNEYSNKISLSFSIVLLNSKSYCQNINKSISYYDFDCDKLNSNGYIFNLSDINKINGFIFPDNSIQFQFKISIKKTPFKS